ncbi:MAG: peptide deformylase [Nitrospinae bacterium]|jgi:peptide deformylase|nr:peptide deformylase [Nitrospinota bacterium]MDA1110029.1 peptide deformylase [Nitrospinota bacterium]
MAKLEIARLGNPVLRQVAQPVNLKALNDPECDIQILIDDMVETMHEEGGVGLAAPQVSRSLQLIIIEAEDNNRYPDREDIPLTVLINPVITHYSEEKAMGWESCLSLIDFRGLVPRSTEVTVEAFNRKGEKTVVEARDFLAIVLQHEIDHLNGIVFIDRMEDFTKLSYMKEFETYWLNQKPSES